MNTLIKSGLTIFALVLIVLIGTIELKAWGDCCDGPGHHNDHTNNTSLEKLNSMKLELGLSEAQVKQIFNVGTKYRELYFKDRGNHNKLNLLRIEHRKQIGKVLTKNQWTIFNRYNHKYNYNRYGWYGGCPW